MRSAFERLRLLIKVGARPKSRLEQARLRIDRWACRLPIPSKFPPLSSSAPDPVVIGATGGSGTRVLVRVLRKAGWFMGERVDTRNEDSLPIACFLVRWLKTLKDFPDVDSELLAKARREFERMIYLHRCHIPSVESRWGWKNPRSLWLIPFLVDRFPQMRFIHMVRDARDMMLSENIYFLRQNGYWLLGSDWWRNPELAQLELWRRSNKRGFEFAKRHLGDRYHIVRYEDLCQKPQETVLQLLAFLGAPEMDVKPLIEGIADRGNIGRWRRTGLAEVFKGNIDIGPDLERFGYQL
jgi:Sulfotransferase family